MSKRKKCGFCPENIIGICDGCIDQENCVEEKDESDEQD